MMIFKNKLERLLLRLATVFRVPIVKYKKYIKIYNECKGMVELDMIENRRIAIEHLLNLRLKLSMKQYGNISHYDLIPFTYEEMKFIQDFSVLGNSIYLSEDLQIIEQKLVDML